MQSACCALDFFNRFSLCRCKFVVGEYTDRIYCHIYQKYGPANVGQYVALDNNKSSKFVI